MTGEVRPLLLVDDNEDIRDVFKVWLDLEGFPLVTHANGKDGLKYLEAGHQPCAVLVDYTMPDMMGVEFVKEVRSRGLIEDVPVYIFSAHTQIQHVDGAAGWIRKPVDLDEVLKILRHVSPSQFETQQKS
jgi:CheY-like chemotaxis protein